MNANTSELSTVADKVFSELQGIFSKGLLLPFWNLWEKG